MLAFAAVNVLLCKSFISFPSASSVCFLVFIFVVGLLLLLALGNNFKILLLWEICCKSRLHMQIITMATERGYKRISCRERLSFFFLWTFILAVPLAHRGCLPAWCWCCLEGETWFPIVFPPRVGAIFLIGLKGCKCAWMCVCCVYERTSCLLPRNCNKSNAAYLSFCSRIKAMLNQRNSV